MTNALNDAFVAPIAASGIGTKFAAAIKAYDVIGKHGSKLLNASPYTNQAAGLIFGVNATKIQNSFSVNDSANLNAGIRDNTMSLKDEFTRRVGTNYAMGVPLNTKIGASRNTQFSITISTKNESGEYIGMRQAMANSSVFASHGFNQSLTMSGAEYSTRQALGVSYNFKDGTLNGGFTMSETFNGATQSSFYGVEMNSSHGLVLTSYDRNSIGAVSDKTYNIYRPHAVAALAALRA